MPLNLEKICDVGVEGPKSEFLCPGGTGNLCSQARREIPVVGEACGGLKSQTKETCIISEKAQNSQQNNQ